MSLVIDELKTLTEDVLALTGFSKLDIDRHEWKQMEKSNLVDDFIIPPFSIWDTRRDYWMKRRDRWVEFFGDSREGREEGVLSPALSRLAKITGDQSFNGTSEFDPVVAEICYKWFCPPGGNILDPFAGGVVRGAVAGTLGYQYTGIDPPDLINENPSKLPVDIVKTVSFFALNDENEGVRGGLFSEEHWRGRLTNPSHETPTSSHPRVPAGMV